MNKKRRPEPIRTSFQLCYFVNFKLLKPQASCLLPLASRLSPLASRLLIRTGRSGIDQASEKDRIHEQFSATQPEGPEIGVVGNMDHPTASL